MIRIDTPNGFVERANLSGQKMVYTDDPKKAIEFHTRKSARLFVKKYDQACFNIKLEDCVFEGTGS